MTHLSPPLIDADVDLRDYPAMLLDVMRLRDSELASHPDGELFRCNVLSWCVAWHQIPAGSLPNDDATLARLLGYGRDLRTWKKVRTAGGLRGWVECSDGRLYHPVVAEKAKDAWRTKMYQRWKTEGARIKKHNQRHNTGIELPEFEDWLSLGCPQGQTLFVPGTNRESPKGQSVNVHGETHSKRSEVKGSKPLKPSSVETTSTTQPPSQGIPPPSPSPVSPEQAERAAVLVERLRKAEERRGKRCSIHAADPRVLRWVQAGITDPQLRDAYDIAVTQREDDRDDSPINAGFLDVFVAKVLNPREVASAVSTATAKRKAVCCGSGPDGGECQGVVTGDVMGRHYCREHHDYAMDPANFRRQT